jgi:hypothetical protein
MAVLPVTTFATAPGNVVGTDDLAGAPQRPRSAQAVEAVEYEVYATLLRDERWSGREGMSQPVFVIQRETAGIKKWLDPEPEAHLPGFPLDLTTRLREASREVIRDFLVRNAVPSVLEGTLPKDLTAIFLTRTEIDALFKRSFDGWKEFYRRYRSVNGITELSRVGLHGDEALVYIGQQSHNLAGAGSLVLLKRVRGTWEVSAIDFVWHS